MQPPFCRLYFFYDKLAADKLYLEGSFAVSECP